MNKADYIRWCQRQNLNLKQDILGFHKTFPPVFSPVKNIVGLDERGEKIFYKGFPQLPERLKPILEQVPGRNAYIGRLRSLTDLQFFNRMGFAMEGFRQVFPEEAGGRYFESIGKTPAEWAIAYDALCKKWPQVDKVTLLWGDFKPYRPSVLIPSLPFDVGKWERDLANLGDGVKIVIPIYEDTSSNDIDWKEIASLQTYLYGAKKRATPSKYEEKIEVWETYRKMREFVKVSKALGMPRTTVKSIWDATHEDIFGSVPKGTMKEKRVIGFDPTSHLDECSTCQKVRYNVEEYCPEMKAWFNEVYGSQRELTTGTVTVDRYRPSRKHPTSDQAFEKEGKSKFQKSYERTYKGR